MDETAAYARVRHRPAGRRQSDQSGGHIRVLLKALPSIHVFVSVSRLRLSGGGGDFPFCLLINQCFVSLTESKPPASETRQQRGKVQLEVERSPLPSFKMVKWSRLVLQRVRLHAFHRCGHVDYRHI